MLSKEQAGNFAKELKIDLFSVYREYLQLLFLKYLYRLERSNQIYFKGETAIRFLYESFRFSEDLDFTSNLEEDETEALIQKAIKNLSREVEVQFKKEKTIANSFTGRVFQNVSDFSFPLTVRIDISLKEKPIYLESNYIETTFPIIPYPLVMHLTAKEILAEKIRAFIIRGKGRDIFDIWFLLSKKIRINWDLVNLKMAYYKRKTNLEEAYYKRKTNLEEIINTISAIPLQEIQKDLTRFLPPGQRPMIKKIKVLLMNKLNELNSQS